MNSKQGQVFAEQAMKNSHPVFSSHYDAAFYWLNIYNKKSIDVNLEIGATIYSVEIDGKVYFNYYNTTVGEEHVIALTLKAPAGTKIRGSIHTHGDESGLSYSDNEFSGYFGELDKGEDIDAYENFYKMNKSITYHYLGTPNGSMLFFDVTKGINDHKTNSTTNFGKILHDDSAVKDKVIESSKKSNSK